MGTGIHGVSEVRVGRLLARPGDGPCLYGATITLRDGRVAAVEASGDTTSAGEGRRFIALPALTNPHDHGRGLRHIAVGARDQMFELWRPALYALPPVDPYLNAAVAFARQARAGVGSIVEVYSSIRTDRLLDDAIAICRAARDVGVRLSFVVPMRDQLTLGYAPDDDLLSRHDPRDHDLIRRTWLYPFPSPGEYMEAVKAVAAACEGPLCRARLRRRARDRPRRQGARDRLRRRRSRAAGAGTGGARLHGHDPAGSAALPSDACIVLQERRPPRRVTRSSSSQPPLNRLQSEFASNAGSARRRV